MILGAPTQTRRFHPLRGWALLLVCALAGFGAVASAEDAEEVPVNVIVVHTSDEAGGVDPRAKDLDAKLKGQLRYNRMKVLREERVNLKMDQVGTIPLPDGRAVRVQPLHKGKQGVLMAVDVEDTVKLDARAPNHHKVVIGAGEYEDGNLAISIEPDYAE
ncbi:MAG: hypothetical protein AAF430_10605 [Myxococcota bacterium]